MDAILTFADQQKHNMIPRNISRWFFLFSFFLFQFYPFFYLVIFSIKETEDYRLTGYWNVRFRGRLDSKKLIFPCLSRRPCLLEKRARRLEIRLTFFVIETSLQLSKCTCCQMFLWLIALWTWLISSFACNRSRRINCSPVKRLFSISIFLRAAAQ